MSKLPKNSPLVKQFGRASVTYDDYAGIHRGIASYLMTHATIPPVTGQILELGAGTGILTELILKNFLGKKLFCLDLSAEMLEVLHRKFPDCHIVQADMSIELPFASENFSLLLSSTALQWAGDEECIRNLIISNLKPDARFIIAIIVKGTFNLLHTVRNSIEPYTPPPLPDYDKLTIALNSNPLRLLRQEQHTFRDIFINADRLFDSIRGLGISGATRSSLSKDNFQNLKTRYYTACEEQGSSPFLDYKVGFFWGEKSLARA